MIKESDLQHYRILIVDDEAPIRRMIRDIIRDMGFVDIHTPKDGDDALVMLATRRKNNPDREPFDLIICDREMPGRTGLDLLKMVRVFYPTLPFILLAADRSAEEVQAALAAKVSAYIAKPVVPKDLQAKVRSLLTNRDS